MNKDTILKYISDLMEHDERIQFEKRLQVDSELKAEFESVKAKLNKFSNDADIELDSSYFNNIVPNVRKKLDSSTSKGLTRFAPAFSFGIASLLIFLLSLPQIGDNSEFNFSLKSDEISSMISETNDTILTDYLETGLVNQYDYYSYQSTTEFPDIYIDDSILSEIGFDNSNDYSELNFTESIDDLSNEEVNLIYEELINKKIL